MLLRIVTVVTSVKSDITLKKMFNLLRLFSVVPLMFAVNVELFDKHKVAETTNGKIRGILNTTLLNDIPFYAFKGIPYAKAPLGPLRFKVHTYKSLFFLLFL